MSLVLEALRRVEKPGTHTETLGVAVSPTGPPRRRGNSLLPLLLGLGTGGLFVFLWGPPFREVPQDGAPAPEQAPGTTTAARALKGRAGLPPMLIPEGVRLTTPALARDEASVGGTRGAGRVRRTPQPVRAEAPQPEGSKPALVLQAVSVRDGAPIAVINDVLVREGDLLRGARIVKIGADSVEITAPDGRPDTVRFAPLPDPTPEATPPPVPR